MGNEESKSKAVGGTVGGATSAGSIAAGVALSIFGGPLGIAFGSMLITAGASSAVSTADQCIKDGNFDYGDWGLKTLDGAVAGTPSPQGLACDYADSHDY